MNPTLCHAGRRIHKKIKFHQLYQKQKKQLVGGGGGGGGGCTPPPPYILFTPIFSVLLNWHVNITFLLIFLYLIAVIL